MAAAILAIVQLGGIGETGGTSRWITEGLLHSVLDGLVVLEPLPERVTVVAIHGGGGSDSLREKPAAEMLLRGRADLIVAMGGPLPLGDPDGTYAGAVVRRLAALGVDPVKVVPLEQGGSTLAELRALRALALARGWSSIALATNRWHMRRVTLSAQNAFRGTSLIWFVIASPDIEPELARWWESSVGRRTVIGEWIKTGVLVVAGRG